MRKTSFMQTVLTWAARATGLGYQLVQPPIGLAEAENRVRRSDRLVVEIEQLERELRRRGRLYP